MSKTKKILIVAPYVTFPDEPGANRFITITKMLSESYKVTLVTSRFCHILKEHRSKLPQLDDINIVLLDEPGYKTNVSLSRIASHHVFCKKFEIFIKQYGGSFDLVYSAFPLIYTNFLLGKYKNSLNYKLVIDVQDIWPDSITGPIPFLSGVLGTIALYPINIYANKTYSRADGLIAVSDTYLNKADVSNLPNNVKKAVYIGTDSIYEGKADCVKVNSSTQLLATYIGTMAGSYDLETVIKAASLCQDKVKVQFIGTGPHELKLKKLNQSLGFPVDFLGVFSYIDAMHKLAQSNIAINPIKADSQASITNKLSDYFSCGVPILSCQENEEVINLLRKGGGMQYKAEDPQDLSEKLLFLANNRENLIKMGEINSVIAKNMFVRKYSYLAIIDIINRVLNQ